MDGRFDVVVVSVVIAFKGVVPGAFPYKIWKIGNNRNILEIMVGFVPIVPHDALFMG